METFVDIISDIGAQISKIKRCRINQQTLNNGKDLPIYFGLTHQSKRSIGELRMKKPFRLILAHLIGFFVLFSAKTAHFL